MPGVAIRRPGGARRAALALALASALACAAAARAGIPNGEPIARLKTTEKVIALSFDDGPEPGGTLDTLLAVLGAHHAHATFFLIGEELARDPDAGVRLLAAGDELGNHTWTHPHLDSIPLPAVRSEIARTDSLLHALGARGRPLVRPPYGALSEAVVQEFKHRHRKVALFDVDPSYDFPGVTSPDSIEAKTLLWLGPGSILVIHPWYGNDGPALTILSPVLDRLEQMGYRIVTVSQLFKLRHAVPELSLYHRVE